MLQVGAPSSSRGQRREATPAVRRTARRVTAEAGIHQQRILFRCWRRREPYDEQRELKALKKSGSSRLKTTEAIRKVYPKKISGFSENYSSVGLRGLFNYQVSSLFDNLSKSLSLLRQFFF
ncbi:MAG: hypothetical protein Q7Q71_15910 [Verrucomicrobiota bacterium JB023]|nr:hypothetical protein [Verrucomicrobiota bacterium JB023]